MVLLNNIELIESENFSFEKSEGIIKFSNLSMEESIMGSWVKIKLPEKFQKGETYFLKIGTFALKPSRLLAGVSDMNGSERKFYSRDVPVGQGVTKDYSVAEKWLKRSSDAGMASSQNLLGTMCNKE